ncbi:spore germination protein [Paenibacillus flagellatus]|uniref:Spore germination protein n=1 Tax=Paenibacillus flagellatus TaxID=2211139 RepID=A0A2V5K6D3_9BACL|nr:spore germination protein [Paenibacillus flagellatus]PYI54931.1 spore germination protein [Paenibacillus flagellatus]
MNKWLQWLRGSASVPTVREEKAIMRSPLGRRLNDNLADLLALFSMTPDLIVRRLVIRKTGKQAALVYMEGLVDKKSVNDNVMTPLLEETKESGELPVTAGPITKRRDWPAIEAALFDGYSVLFVDGMREAYLICTQGWPQRAIEDPQLEASLKGAHQGFVETGSQNVALIRRYIPNRELKIKEMNVGLRGRAKVSILYVADVVNAEVLRELETRIGGIDVDAILSSGELAEYIEDNPYSPFPQFISTERPDAASSHLLQGRIAMIVDRSPSVLIGPVTFSSFFQSVDDYGTRWLIASFLRLLRFLGFIVAIMLPAVYIAVISFNYEIIPLDLLISLGESRERVPFPPIIEALVMEITLEMLREAGIRLPTPIGQTVGIVGGIVIGQAAVQAGIVSNMMVIIVASTAIASFILPSYDMASAIRLLRFPMMIVASMFGIVGIAVGLMTLIGHLIALESLGTPYGSPFAPVRLADWKDMLIRLPLWQMKRRPAETRAKQRDRSGSYEPGGGSR